MLVHSDVMEGGSPARGSEIHAREGSLMLSESPDVSVLIVDDEALIRWSLAETLGDHGYGVLQAADGQGAVEALTSASRPVDVIMLDYQLPDSNNLQLLARIRAMSPRSHVVLMTAFGTPEMAAEALRLGACCVVNKPIDMREVADLVSRAHSSSPA